MAPVLGPAAGTGPAAPPDALAASAPRPDVPPVDRASAPAVIAPRPPDQLRLGLVQASLLAAPAPASDHSPERVLKPWGVAILPDSARAEERREKQAQQIAEAARARPTPDPEIAPPLESETGLPGAPEAAPEAPATGLVAAAAGDGADTGMAGLAAQTATGADAPVR
ncbi:MAG: hypothetical protein ACU0A0_12565 [Limimaricola sp.]